MVVVEVAVAVLLVAAAAVVVLPPPMMDIPLTSDPFRQEVFPGEVAVTAVVRYNTMWNMAVHLS